VLLRTVNIDSTQYVNQSNFAVSGFDETILRKMVASDLNVDINDLEEQGVINHTLEKVLASKWQLFTSE